MHRTSHQGDTLAKVQYLSIVPDTVKYRLVYLKDKDGKVRDFNADEYDEFLNDFHGSLFVKWEQQKSDTLEYIDFNRIKQAKNIEKNSKTYNYKLMQMIVKYDSTINKYHEKVTLACDSILQKEEGKIEKKRKIIDSLKKQTDKKNKETLMHKRDSLDKHVNNMVAGINKKKTLSHIDLLDKAFSFA